MSNFDVVVVGLGTTGSAAACTLASRGLRVLGLDRYQPPHRHGSHHGESRIIRKAYYEHPAYVPMLERAFAAWRELEARAHATLLRRTGGLMIGLPTGQLVPGVLASARVHRLPHEVLSSDALAARYPQLRVDPAIEAQQAERLATVRSERDADAVESALTALREAARGTANCLYPMKEALAARATVGEVCDALREVWGVYVPAETF